MTMFNLNKKSPISEILSTGYLNKIVYLKKKNESASAKKDNSQSDVDRRRLKNDNGLLLY